MERSARASEDRMEHGNEALRYSDYFVLDTVKGCWTVSRVMAEFVERELDRWPRRRWISFVDVVGARVRLRAELINAVRQSSRDIRDEWRRFYKEREQEEEKDWDDEF